jgi:DNA-binding beta-propeller fold protein YncE
LGKSATEEQDRIEKQATRSIAMKSAKTIAATLLCLFVFAAASFAGNLNGPFGLALDAKGSLWVANLDANTILEFDPNYVLQTSATITQGLNMPTSVAFDAAGNLWVSNFGASNGGSFGSISMYTNGVQNTAATITDSIVAPFSINVDGLGNIWVSNDSNYITVYAMPAPNSLPTSLVGNLNFPGFEVHGLTVSSGSFAFGTGTKGVLVCPPQWDLTKKLISGFQLPLNDSGAAMATAANGNIYIGNSDGTVNVFNPTTNIESRFLQLTFVPSGMVVDSVRGRLYISNGNYGTAIYVYSLTGTLLQTIQ